MGFDVLLKYFASIGVVIGLINTFTIYKRIEKLNPNMEDDEKSFMKWYGVGLTVPFLLIQVFQLTGNYKTVFYLFLLDFNNPSYIFAFVTIILFWLGELYLVVIKNGAEVMAKYHKAFGNMSADKTTIKIIHVVMVAAGVLGLLLGNKFMNGAFLQFEGINMYF